MLAWWLVFFFLDNIFYGRAAVQYPNPADLAGFLGTYLGGLAILTLLSNFFISGRIIGWYGLRLSLLLLPIGLACASDFRSQYTHDRPQSARSIHRSAYSVGD